ncbi:MAG: hypothetical protein M3R02_20065 [Chloroflexota bacterium]|nr:hypothetical protein [Chloroflexota bacterium]
MSRGTGRIISGLVLAAFGLLWTLQGLDLLGQDGGMNGRGEWSVIGLLTLAAGLVLVGAGVLRRRS